MIKIKNNLAQELGFILNALVVILVIAFIFFVPGDMDLILKIIYGGGMLIGGLVTGTILITLGKILEVLEDQNYKG